MVGCGTEERIVHLDLQRAIVRQVLDHAAAGTTQLAAAPFVVPAADYTSRARFDAEQRVLFRDRPVVACLSGDVRNPGDVFAGSSGGVPYLAVRRVDGSLGAFANICRHRGAPLVAEGASHAERHLRCRFHGWTYDHDGVVTARPNAGDAFAGAAGCDALVGLAVCEHAGMVLVRPSGDRPIEPEELLAGMTGELEEFGFGSYHRVGSWTAEWSANWKLLLDTFLETYHVPTLHPTTVARHFLARPSVMQAFGPNIRFHSLMRSILDLAGTPEAEWSLLPHGTVEYVVAPNTVFNFSVDHLALYQFHPLAPDRTRSVLTLYTAEPVAEDDDATAEHFRRTLRLHERVSGGEDFVLQEQIHRALCSGLQESVTFGRNEPAAIAFHAGLDALLDGSRRA